MAFKFYQHFAKHIPDLRSDVAQQKVLCIFHEEANKSLSLDLEKGLYHCFGCEEKGDIVQFLMKAENLTFKEAKKEIFGEVKGVLSEGEVLECHNYLLKKEFLMRELFRHRYWSEATIAKFKIGYHEAYNRITIPIYDEVGRLKNIRYYKAWGELKTHESKIFGVKGHNQSYFFPISNLVTEDEYMSKFICLMAGEPDTILANQFKINAGTFTGGEGSFNRDLLPLFTNKTVYICYDKDYTGLTGLKNLGPELYRYAKEIKRINLPFDY